MDMTGEYRIAAPRQTVWEALNDPDVLKQCIPGCDEIEKRSDTEFAAKVTAKVGPVKARFAGKVTLSDLDPPNGYKITGEGSGGAAGFAKGGADVHLEEDGRETVLRYVVRATVGGKLAQIGSRLIDGTARKMADEFFGCFAERVGAPAAAEPAAASEPAITPEPAVAPPRPDEQPPAAPTAGIRPLIWVSALIAAVVLLLIVFGVNN
ncbi:SRPBCC family protein [Rhodospirillaceae bacterium SYSU D60014]|uniref:SRPBCC family protein n=1 Tax=Virgifigura deserti TaxID=2268457 RepID=UPI000E671080